jgi:hypothetical protein
MPYSMTLPERGMRLGCHARSLWFNVGAQDRLYTTCILVKVLYSVEQPCCCDLLRLNL